MEFLEWSVPKNYELILFGDNQEGNLLQYKKGYAATIDYILGGKNRFGIHMGDEMESYFIDDPRYDPAILQTDPLTQQEVVIQNLMPLSNAGKLITILYGNHSARLYPKVGNITKATCQRLGVAYGGFSCVVSFVNGTGDTQFRGFFTHGRKSIRSIADDPVRREANEKLQLKQHLKHKVGDCLLMAKGHTHRLIVAEPTPQLYLTSDRGIKQHYTHNPAFGKGGYIHPDHRWYANTGSFLKTFGEGVTGYAEMGEYDPIELGYIIVSVEKGAIVNVRKVVI